MLSSVYFVVNCKTPKCERTVAVKYLGSKRPQTVKRPKRGFQFVCMRCQRVQLGKPADLRFESYDFSKPEGWRDLF